jgi:hypothetical protein
VNKSKTIYKRRDRRKSIALLKKGVVRHPQSAVGHHSSSGMFNVIAPSRKIGESSKVKKINLQEQMRQAINEHNRNDSSKPLSQTLGEILERETNVRPRMIDGTTLKDCTTRSE